MTDHHFSKTKGPLATILLSGGIDSAACMKFVQSRGYTVQTLFIDYGQSAAEIESRVANELAVAHGCKFEAVKVSSSAVFVAGEVVGRNAFLIFTALLSLRGTPGLIVLGLHAGTAYYDCSQAFLDLIGRLVGETTNGQVALLAPFITWSKQDVYRYFLDCGLSLKDVYSCEAGAPEGCGTCLSCHDRQRLEC